MKIFFGKEIIFKCLVAFLKIFFIVWLHSRKYYGKHIFYYFLTFSHLPSKYIIKKKENFRLKKNHDQDWLWWRPMAVVGYRRLRTFMGASGWVADIGGGGSVNKFQERRKVGYRKWKHKPISTINSFILWSIGKQFPVDQHFLLPQTPVNVKNIFRKSIYIVPNTT